MDIRFLTSDDANEWSRLRLQALQGDPEAFSSSVEEHQILTSEDVARRIASETGDSFVAGAFDAGRLTGMAGFFREKGPKLRHKGHIWGVYLAPEYRGKGVGRKLLETVLKRATAIQGLELVLISVASTQTTAISLYRSLGFARFGVDPRALKVNGRLIDEEHMFMANYPSIHLKSVT